MPEINPDILNVRVATGLFAGLQNEADGGTSTQYLSRAMGISSRVMHDRLARMTRAGYIVAIGKNTYDLLKRYLPAKESL